MAAKKKGKKQKKDELKGKKRILEPHELSSGKWQVSLGVRVEDGKRVWKRKQFTTRAAAQDFCNERRKTIQGTREKAAEADSGLVSAWMKMDANLKAAGVDSLLEAGKRMLRDAKAVQKTGTAQECFDAFHQYHVEKPSRGTYRSELRNRCGRFLRYVEKGQPAWKDRAVLEITPEAIEAYLATLRNKGDFKTISAWLGWAAKYRWLPSNPCTGNKPDSRAPGTVVTLSPPEAARLLKLAVETENWDVVAHVSISLFAGLRPAEFRKVAKGDAPAFFGWELFTPSHIALPPQLSKNGRRSGQGRTIKIGLSSWHGLTCCGRRREGYFLAKLLVIIGKNCRK